MDRHGVLVLSNGISFSKGPSINRFFDSTLAVWEVGFNRHLVLTKIECVLRILFVFRSLKSFQQVF